jgi:hypothetical protein
LLSWLVTLKKKLGVKPTTIEFIGLWEQLL